MIELKQKVTIQSEGVIEIRSPELQEGMVADVTVTVYSPDTMAKLERAQVEVHREINIRPELEGEEALAYPERLRYQ